LNRHLRSSGWGDNIIGEEAFDVDYAKIFRFKHVNDAFGELLLLYQYRTDTFAVAAHRTLLYYALTELGLDTDSAIRRARDQQIELPNSTELIARMSSPDSASQMEG